MDARLLKITRQVAREEGIEPIVAEKIIRSAFEFLRQNCENLDLDNPDIKNLRILNFGLFYTNEETIDKIKKIKNARNSN